jgi:hypothetical protein
MSIRSGVPGPSDADPDVVQLAPVAKAAYAVAA